MQKHLPQITDIPLRASRVSAYKHRNTDSIQATPKPVPKTIQLETPKLQRGGLSTGCLFGIGVVVILVPTLFYLFVFAPWKQNLDDQYAAGYGRVSKLQANVGHEGTCTFLSLDLHGQAMVIEVFQDTHKPPVVYKGPQLEGNMLIVGLSIVDVNHDGKPDLAVHVENSDAQMVLINNGSGFQWTTT